MMWQPLVNDRFLLRVAAAAAAADTNCECFNRARLSLFLDYNAGGTQYRQTAVLQLIDCAAAVENHIGSDAAKTLLLLCCRCHPAVVCVENGTARRLAVLTRRHCSTSDLLWEQTRKSSFTLLSLGVVNEQDGYSLLEIPCQTAVATHRLTIEFLCLPNPRAPKIQYAEPAPRPASLLPTLSQEAPPLLRAWRENREALLVKLAAPEFLDIPLQLRMRHPPTPGTRGATLSAPRPEQLYELLENVLRLELNNSTLKNRIKKLLA
jgi:hypothetical protein